MLIARQDVHDRAARVVAGSLAGVGGALVVVGEPGAGKSTVLAQALEFAGDRLVLLQTTGVPVEQGVPHAALHGLLRPLADLLPGLPAAQERALSVALGLAEGPAPTPLLLGAATLSMLAARAHRDALLVVIDDAQWVDDGSLQALAFAARRLAGERIGVLMAARTEEAPPALDGLERCVLRPLTPAQAGGLDRALAPSVAEALVQLSAGNALAFVELASALDDEQRAGRAELSPAPAGPLFARPAADLARPVLRAAALAALAAEAPPAVWVAARALLDLPDLTEAEDAGLLVAGADGVRWRHPVARQAVLDELTAAERKALARALAEAAAGLGVARAVVVSLRLAAVDGPDEALAVDVEAAAREAAAGGDHDLSGRLWQQAAAVGTELERHAARLFEAAESVLRAGHPVRARDRYAEAQAAGLDPLRQTLTHLALGRIEHTGGSPRRALDEMRAAAACAPETALRVRACAEGVLAAMYAGSPEVASQLAGLARDAHDPSDVEQQLLVRHAQGAAAALSGDLATARPLLAQAMTECGPALERRPDLVLWVISASLFSGSDADLGMDAAAAAYDRLRLTGDLTWLPRVSRLWGLRHEQAGRWLVAYAAYEEAVDLSRTAQQSTQLVEALLALAHQESFRGEKEACLAHLAEVDQLMARLDVPFLAEASWWPRGLLHLGLGEPGLAASALTTAMAQWVTPRLREEVGADLVEALLLDGRQEEAAQVGAEVPSLRSAGLLASDDAEAVALLVEAAETGDDLLTGARSSLLAGERLRRAGRRRESREHLRRASDVFVRAGAQPWVRRADEGLRASGETLQARDERPEELTGAELRVAHLVVEGRPTREVAALLFLSPKTVEFHLGRIYRKLGVRGRVELARVLGADTDPG